MQSGMTCPRAEELVLVGITGEVREERLSMSKMAALAGGGPSYSIQPWRQ